MKDTNKDHTWTFFRYEGVVQVVLNSAEDLRHLRDLDLKLWMALTMPVKGTTIDPLTTTAIDKDKDGRIHRDEILDALEWTSGVIRDPALLVKSGNTIPLADITDPKLLASAEDALRRMGKADATEITFEEARSAAEAFAKTAYNGDGVVLPDVFGDAAGPKALAEAAIAVAADAAPKDRCGAPGVNKAALADFRAKAQAMLDWLASSAASAAAPLDLAATAKAAAAVHAVEGKVEDYFTRCRLADFDAKAVDPLNRSAADYQAVAGNVLASGTPELAAFPLAAVAPDKPLPLVRHVNPAWAAALSAFLTNAARPLLGDDELVEITEEQWRAVKAAIAPYEAHEKSKPAGPIGGYDADTLRKLLSEDDAKAVEKAIDEDASFAPQAEIVDNVEKLLRFRRDLPTVLQNFVSFVPFYAGEKAIFQTGVLYIDGRCCELCIDVVDDGKHGTMAPLSGFYLAYCDLKKADGATKKIVAAITDGDCDNLMVGRNGLFIDHKGVTWDASVSKIVAAPVSIREAFWAPYKKLVRLIEDQINKRASAADAAANAKIEAGAATAVDSTAGAAAPAAPAPAPDQPKKIDLGTIALIGTAIGGVSALIAGFLKTLFGLGWWIPLGVLGVLLLISGPSMLLAALKLKRRNLAPLLDANGWAINTRARINIPFASHLTPLATLPAGTVPTVSNPFERKGRRRVIVIRRILIGIVLLAIAGTVAYYLGAYNWVRDKLRRESPETAAAVEEVVDKAAETVQDVVEDAEATAQQAVENASDAVKDAAEASAPTEAAPEAPAAPAAD